jgi:hypothetical protein
VGETVVSRTLTGFFQNRFFLICRLPEPRPSRAGPDAPDELQYHGSGDAAKHLLTFHRFRKIFLSQKVAKSQTSKFDHSNRIVAAFGGSILLKDEPLWFDFSTFPERRRRGAGSDCENTPAHLS